MVEHRLDGAGFHRRWVVGVKVREGIGLRFVMFHGLDIAWQLHI